MSERDNSLSARDAILDATDRALATVGYKKMKIEDLAREAGIGKGSVYLHFASKEDIAIAHIERIISKLRDELHQIEALDLSAADRLYKMLNARVLTRFDAVEHYAQGFDEMIKVVRTRLLEGRKRHFQLEAEMMSRVIAEGQANGEFDTGDSLEVAETLVDATNSLLPYSLTAIELTDREDVEKRSAALSKLLISGLRYRCQ